MAKDRKVLPFTGKFKKQSPRLSENDRRAAATATIGFVLFLMVGFNFSLFEAKGLRQDDVSSGVRRGIASVPVAYEPQWRKNLAQINSKIIAESSLRPSTIDKLNFGLLAGEYSMKIDRGHITKIEFAKAENTAPRLLGDRKEFLSEYAQAFVPGFKSVRKLASEQADKGFVENYEVISSKGSSTFKFHLDFDERFLSLDVK